MKICVIPGDGIGPEIVAAALPVLAAVGRREGFSPVCRTALLGGAAIDAAGTPLPDETLRLAEAADAILLGAVGGPKWDGLPRHLRPEMGLLGIRRHLGLFANLRPAFLFPELAAASTLRPEVVAGLDLLIVRELTGDIYFGQPRGIEERNGERVGFNTMVYSEYEIRRIAEVAFETARKRRGKVTSVDKMNVLECMQLWREVVTDVGRRFPDVELEHMLVDNAAMQLVRNPGRFDVMLTGNMFGDILSDEASMLTGSIGMLPSASLNDRGQGMYEPCHGSAPDIAGLDLANPLATILSIAMMLRHGFGLERAAERVEEAVRTVLCRGLRTADIAGPGSERVGSAAMGQQVVCALESQP